MNSLEGYAKKTEKKLNLSERIAKIWRNIPFFNKLLLILTFIFYILNLLIKNISFYFSNIPYFTIFYFQLWRIITTVFISTNLFKLILGLIFWIKYASSLESSIGTIKYMIIFYMNTLFIQIIFCIFNYSIMKLLKKDNSYLLNKVSSKGIINNSLLGNILCELTLLCISNPETPNKLFLIPFIIKAKYYPFTLFIIFTIIDSFKIDLEIVSGILYAYIYYYFLKNFLKISDNFAQKIEDSFCSQTIIELNSFVSISNINNGNPISIMNVSVNQIKIDINRDNETEEMNINKGVTISGIFEDAKNEYSKIQPNEV